MALLSPRHLDPVVPIGVRRGRTAVEFVATGFTYDLWVGDRSLGNEKFCHFIVTNRHVIEHRETLFVRQNYSSDTHVSINSPRDAWFFHPNPDIEVAVLQYDLPDSNGEPIKVPHPYNNRLALQREQLTEVQFGEGDEVFVLGFPLAMVAGGHRNYAIVRQGVIARIQDWYDHVVESFLIDALVFPGNSGGPVLTKPTSYSAHGNPIDHAYLIGMVSESVAYESTARSERTGRVVLASTENTGLAQVIPIETIEETIRLALRPDPA